MKKGWNYRQLERGEKKVSVCKKFNVSSSNNKEQNFVYFREETHYERKDEKMPVWRNWQSIIGMV
jgi:hypothetical protein